MTEIENFKYPSLENYREEMKNKYLKIYNRHILVQEKIHGSNVCIVIYKEKGELNFKLGSRNRFLEPDEKFHNFQSIFEQYKQQIIDLSNNLYDKNNTNKIIRLFGEIYGGKYGDTKDNKALKVQKEPNYYHKNDIAFFDIIIDGEKLPIMESNELFKQYDLKFAPVIYKGELEEFLKTFNINSFNSVISKQFYNLPFLNTPKATEGVTIRTINSNPSYKEKIILKYKKDWALECGKKINNNMGRNDKNSKYDKYYKLINENRFNSYKSKNTIDDITNKKLLGFHIKEIVNDIIIDIKKTISYQDYIDTDININNIKKILSKRMFPMFKKYINELVEDDLTIGEKIVNMEKNNSVIEMEINSIRNRLKIISERIL